MWIGKSNSNSSNFNLPIKSKFDKGGLEQLPDLSVSLLNRRITCMTSSAIVRAIRSACIENRKITVANYNVHSFNLSMQLPWYYEFLQNADIAHCDSSGILKGLSFMGLNLPMQYRVSYTIMIPMLLEHCCEHELSLFLLGSKPQNLEAALTSIHKKYPRIKLDGHHGYFNRKDLQQNQAIIQRINSQKTNVLLLGMGMPIQEDWVRQYRDRLNVNAFLMGGAVIDRLAGAVASCPEWISNIGCEWLYRLCLEPKRLGSRYLFGNLAFAFHIALYQFNVKPHRKVLLK
jgi:N-acetylglucosaminyldiphosphoundecaprenol N-acetyl-beta-D-mannosaminyltransferase